MQIIKFWWRSPGRVGINLCEPSVVKRATLINDIHWRFRADNSAIHQPNLTIRSVLAPTRAKSIKVIDCGCTRFPALTGDLHGGWDSRVRAYTRELIPGTMHHRVRGSRASNASSGNLKLMRIAQAHSHQSKRDVRSYFLSNHVCKFRPREFRWCGQTEGKTLAAIHEISLNYGAVFLFTYLMIYRPIISCRRQARVRFGKFLSAIPRPKCRDDFINWMNGNLRNIGNFFL